MQAGKLSLFGEGMRNERAHGAREREAKASDSAIKHKISTGTTLSGFQQHDGCLQTGLSKETQDMGRWEKSVHNSNV